MVILGCKFLSNLVFKSHSIVIRMDDTTFLATSDDTTNNVGFVNLTKAELKDFTTSTGSDKGKHITPMLKTIGIVFIFRSQTRNNDGNRKPCVKIETKV